MKIAMFTNTYQPHVGGVACSVDAFTRDLMERGHEVLVVCPTFPEADEIGRDGHVLRVPALQNFNGSDFSVRIPMPFLISSEMDDFNPQLIHSHHPFLLGDAALREARKRRRPLVFTHHTLYERYTHYTPVDSEAMADFVINLSTIFANHCQRVVAPSESVKKIIQERGVQTPVRVVPTGVDVKKFASGDGAGFRKKHHIPEEALVVGHLGRLAPEKNLEYLARSVVHCLERVEEAFFLIAGSGPSLAEVREIFGEAGLADRLKAVGVVTGQATADCYAAMDIFAFASTSETQGLVLAETMAASTPVIALDASGSREVVRDMMNGRLLPGNAPEEAFAEALTLGLMDRELRREWQKAARETAREFSREVCVEKLEGVYGEALEAFEPDSDHADVSPWEELQEALRFEWELFSKKFDAAAQAVLKQME